MFKPKIYAGDQIMKKERKELQQVSWENEINECCMTPLIIFCIIFATTIGLSIAAIAETAENQQWNQSLCLVTNMTIGNSVYINGNSDNAIMATKWNVVYFNGVLNRNTEGIVQVDPFVSTDTVNNWIISFGINTTNPCYYRNQTFQLYWINQPSNLQAVTITAIVFSCISFFLSIISCCCSKKLRAQYYYHCCCYE
jgi:hypothetical protein